jgi:hypothetical protein
MQYATAKADAVRTRGVRHASQPGETWAYTFQPTWVAVVMTVNQIPASSALESSFFPFTPPSGPKQLEEAPGAFLRVAEKVFFDDIFD